jgi:hypothetical protein
MLCHDCLGHLLFDREERISHCPHCNHGQFIRCGRTAKRPLILLQGRL